VDDDRREELARAFTAERARLVSLAYRMIGGLADADDVVQGTWIRLQRADADTSTAPRDLPAWLTTTATRLALDHLRAAGRRKETYVGPWLPEPRVEPAHQQQADPERAAALAS
jgi:RNA polymerase sigma-70 factor (ECF subfamily)